MLFEREHDGRFRPPESYPRDALTTFNTHDLAKPSRLAVGYDLRIKRQIGIDPGESDDARHWAQQKLRDILHERAHAFAADDFAAVAAFLAATPSRLVVVALDDILGVVEQINIPGTVDQHPNWRRKLPVALEELDRHAGLRGVADAFAQAGRGFSLET